MALIIKHVPAANGAVWVRDGFRTFFRRPLAFVGLYALILLAGVLVSVVPVLGGILVVAALPLVSMGYMIATRSALNNGPVHPGHFIEPLTKTDDRRRRAMLILCAAYAATGIAIYLFSDWADGGSFSRLQILMSSPDTDLPKIEAELAESQVAWGVMLRLVLLSLVSVPFWHAPALVHWGHQGAAQSLFSSTLALWRNRGAFAVYGLAWSAAFFAFGIVMALLMVVLGVTGGQQIVGLAVGPVALMFSAAFYVSLLFTFDDCFVSSTATVVDTPSGQLTP